MARKYGKKAAKKVERAMSKRKRGTLKSSSGRKVTSRKQAVAIGLSEARRAGAKVPKKKTSKASNGRKKSTKKSTRKTAKKKTTTRKPASKKK